MGCRCLLQGAFPTQGLDSCLLHCREILYCLCHQGRPHLGPASAVLLGIVLHVQDSECEFLEDFFFRINYIFKNLPKCWSLDVLAELTLLTKGGISNLVPAFHPSLSWAGGWGLSKSSRALPPLLSIMKSGGGRTTLSTSLNFPMCCNKHKLFFWLGCVYVCI